VPLEKERIEGKTFQLMWEILLGVIQHEINDKIYSQQIGSRPLKIKHPLILIFSILNPSPPLPLSYIIFAYTINIF
jgi:hypothetical protein